MSSKSTPLSFRVTDEDAEFLAGLEIAGAVTPSEKLRVLITRARMEHSQSRSYESSLTRVRELLEPTAQILRAHDVSSRQRSVLLAETLEWLPDLMACLMAGPEESKKPDKTRTDKALQQFEADAAERLFRMVEALLRLGITSKAPCYNPELISHGLAGTLELSQLIVSNRSSKPANKK